MAVQFFGETGPIRVPFRPQAADEATQEAADDQQVADPQVPEQGATNGKRRPKHRASKKDSVRSNP